jgi:hypothetical protein
MKDDVVKGAAVVLVGLFAVEVGLGALHEPVVGPPHVPHSDHSPVNTRAAIEYVTSASSADLSVMVHEDMRVDDLSGPSVFRLS